MSDVVVKLMKNGPILLSGSFTLQDSEGNAIDTGDKDTVALCRCGATKNSPFCDGSHKSCGFQSGESAG